MAENFLDNRDDIEKEFDNQLLEDSEYSEDFVSEDVDVTGEEITGEVTDAVTVDNPDEESNPDNGDEVGNLRIQNKNYHKTITSDEAAELRKDLERKNAELEVAREKLREAREAGDLSENEAYTHFKGVVYGLESDIISIENELKTSHIVDNENSDKVIGKGSKVHLVIKDISGILPTEDLTVTIVSEGHGGISSDGSIKIPSNSEVYRNMADRQSGSFDLTGTDGNNYNYTFELIRG